MIDRLVVGDLAPCNTCRLPCSNAPLRALPARLAVVPCCALPCLAAAFAPPLPDVGWLVGGGPALPSHNACLLATPALLLLTPLPPRLVPYRLAPALPLGVGGYLTRCCRRPSPRCPLPCPALPRLASPCPCRLAPLPCPHAPICLYPLCPSTQPCLA